MSTRGWGLDGFATETGATWSGRTIVAKLKREERGHRANRGECDGHQRSIYHRPNVSVNHRLRLRPIGEREARSGRPLVEQG